MPIPGPAADDEGLARTALRRPGEEDEMSSAPATAAGSRPFAASQAWWFLGTLVVEHRMATSDLPVILESTLPVGAAPPRHLHNDADDSYYLLAGEIVVRSGDQMSLARPGQWVSLPRGVPHSFRVVGSEPARMLGVHADAGFVEFIHDLGEPAAALELPPPGDGPSLEDLSRSMAEHDVIVVGPSMTEDEARAFLASLG
ncbi:MAG TPA: cupin domain-containing protein [Streptosporangiaceae bacterium]